MKPKIVKIDGGTGLSNFRIFPNKCLSLPSADEAASEQHDTCRVKLFFLD
jgi:hypothetical protein